MMLGSTFPQCTGSADCPEAPGWTPSAVPTSCKTTLNIQCTAILVHRLQDAWQTLGPGGGKQQASALESKRQSLCRALSGTLKCSAVLEHEQRPVRAGRSLCHRGHHPNEHPYSKKILYVETKYPRIYYGEAYNRKGEFWKFLEFHSFPAKADDGFLDIRTSGGAIIDFARNHATVFLVDTPQWKTNPSGFKPGNVSLNALEAAGR